MCDLQVWNQVPWLTSFAHSEEDINLPIPKGMMDPLKVSYTGRFVCLLVVCLFVFCLPVDKIFTLSELNAFLGDNFIVAQRVQLLFERIENILGKDENAG